MSRELAPSPSNPDVDRFDRWAATYDGSVLQKVFFGPIQSKMLKLIENEALRGETPKRFLDVGCGTGRLLRAAALRWPGVELFGADPAEHMVSEALRLSEGITVKLAPAESLPYEDESTDVVASSLSFHHWADQAKGIGEIARVLRSGGFFCLADHTFPPAKMTGVKTKSRSQVRALMTEAGLSVLHQQWVRFPFILVTLARKPDAG